MEIVYDLGDETEADRKMNLIGFLALHQ